MVNARILSIGSMQEAMEEVRKIRVHDAAVKILADKALHLCVKLTHVKPFAANIIKQEMLGKGGDVAVSKGVADFSDEFSDVLIMGTLAQFHRFLAKLECQKGSLCEIGEEIRALIENAETEKAKCFHCRKYDLPLGKKTYVMGILNVTPDSFSDGGSYGNVEIAVRKALLMAADGADIIDIGGESTRPGYTPVTAEEEIQRVLPVISRLKAKLDVPVSIDTMKAAVAEKALAAGADIINDIWGLQKDPDMARVAAEYDAGVILMHNSDSAVYNDLMGDILKFLRESIKIAENAGIPWSNIVIDPGIGFAKNLAQNLEVMHKLEELQSLCCPVLLGTSRKSMIGGVLGLPADERIEGTAATVVLGIEKGVDFIRVHDVKEMARVSRMTDAIVRRQEI